MSRYLPFLVWVLCLGWHANSLAAPLSYKVLSAEKGERVELVVDSKDDQGQVIDQAETIEVYQYHYKIEVNLKGSTPGMEPLAAIAHEFSAKYPNRSNHFKFFANGRAGKNWLAKYPSSAGYRVRGLPKEFCDKFQGAKWSPFLGRCITGKQGTDMKRISEYADLFAKLVPSESQALFEEGALQIYNGRPKDGLKFLMKSSEMGHLTAQLMIGEYYLKADKPILAHDWLERSVTTLLNWKLERDIAQKLAEYTFRLGDFSLPVGSSS